jgi:formiminoglutamate deiminase
MITYKLKGLLQNSGWISPAFLSVDADGKIVSISAESESKIDHDLNVYGLPGFQNAHSHAFQYAMAGLAERHSTTETPDDFWSWREAMYKLALSINPDELEAIAGMLYSEMMRHGYTRVAEFHYVHHDKNGKPYDHLAEMGERLISAASAVGIGITLVPIFYQKGGFGKPPTEGQKRFISGDAQTYLRLLEASELATKNYANSNVATGIHSLRGVDPDSVKEVLALRDKKRPVHIHVSEQLKEIEDCLVYTGKRPVQWMLENFDLGENFHLVHATHLSEGEITGLAKSGAHVVLCPTTEGNLGDGIFPFREYRDLGGKWSIGTDSHIGLNPLEELRLLDYGQRLISHKRNIFYARQQGDSGRFAIDEITKSGRMAMNNPATAFFEPGKPFDAALIDADAPLIAASGPDVLLSTIVYAGDSSIHKGVISAGKLVQPDIENTKLLREKFVQCIKNIGNRL